jgi:hypothetical protein
MFLSCHAPCTASNLIGAWNFLNRDKPDAYDSPDPLSLFLGCIGGAGYETKYAKSTSTCVHVSRHHHGLDLSDPMCHIKTVKYSMTNLIATPTYIVMLFNCILKCWKLSVCVCACVRLYGSKGIRHTCTPNKRYMITFGQSKLVYHPHLHVASVKRVPSPSIASRDFSTTMWWGYSLHNSWRQYYLHSLVLLR